MKLYLMLLVKLFHFEPHTRARTRYLVRRRRSIKRCFIIITRFKATCTIRAISSTFGQTQNKLVSSNLEGYAILCSVFIKIKNHMKIELFTEFIHAIEFGLHHNLQRSSPKYTRKFTESISIRSSMLKTE